MSLRPWMKFYPADWQSDQGLRSVSLAARGLWIECMAIMHRATPYGHLLVNGRPPTDTQLAMLVGALPDQIPGLLDELENAGVFSRSRTRVIYSRRMTRDEKKRVDGEKSAETGQIPGSRRSRQTTENKREKLPPPGVVVGVAEQPPLSQKPDIQREKEEPNGSSKKKGSRLSPEWQLPKSWGEWAVSQGLSEPQVRREADKFRDFFVAKTGKDAAKLDWEATWRNWVRNSLDRYGVGGPAKPPPSSSPSAVDWPKALEVYQKYKSWHASWGPTPDEYGCRCPPQILAEHGYRVAA